MIAGSIPSLFNGVMPTVWFSIIELDIRMHVYVFEKVILGSFPSIHPGGLRKTKLSLTTICVQAPYSNLVPFE